MAKNTRTKPNESGKQADQAGQNPSNKKPKRDGKPKKPQEDDHLQQIPFRLREIMKSQERMKMGPSRIKKMKKAAISKARTEDSQVEDIPVPRFRRKRNETEKAYIRRMESKTKHVLFLTKNQLERKPELAAEKQEKAADKRKSEKKKEYDTVRLQRLHQKKLNRQEEEMEKEMLIDPVAFGEVVMAPPTLSAKPRKAPIKSQGAPKGLLLNSLLGHTVAFTAKPSMARQRIMEEERVRVVEAYRHLKKRKLQEQEIRAAGLKKLKKRPFGKSDF